jgi:hypothetical protein
LITHIDNYTQIGIIIKKQLKPPSEVKVMIAKLDWLKEKLKTPEFVGLKLLTAASVDCGHDPYVWIATSTIAIRSGSREARQLELAGLKPPVRRLNI